METNFPAGRITRRSMLTTAAASVLALRQQARAADISKLKVAIFSKHLQFLNGTELARQAAEIGFDGVDITVRAGGHVEPARVAADLPPLVKTIRDHGLEVPMVTTDIVDADTPYAEDVIKTISSLNIRHYRWGGLRYKANQPLPEQLDEMRSRIGKLAVLNTRYRVGAMYHTHSGRNVVGAPIWDLHELLTTFDPSALGINYDVGHATIEGGLGGWIDSLQVCGAHLQGVAVKDFIWAKDAKGEWTVSWQPIGRGMVRFKEFFTLLSQRNFHGPLQLHFEYKLGGAGEGKRTLTIPRAQVYAAMKRDVRQLRAYMKQASTA